MPIEQPREPVPAHLLDIPGNDVPRNDPSDQFHHSISDTTDDINGEKTIRIPRSVLLLSSVHVLRFSSGGGIGDEQDGGDDTESEDGTGQDGSGWESFHQGRDEDGSDLCELTGI
jgi:hypothetical protein